MSQENESYIKGKPIVTIFHNEQNLYTVLRIRVEESNLEMDEKEVAVTGYFPVFMMKKHTYFMVIFKPSEIWQTISGNPN